MSVLDITPIKSHVYTGVGVYQFDFKTYLSTDLVCTVLMPDGSTRRLVKDTDYSVSIAAAPTIGGSVTLLANNNPTATKLQILREVPFTQEVDWENGGPLDQPLLTRSMDKLTMLLQQMQATVGGQVLTSNWRGDWVTSTRYYLKDLLRGPNGNWYACQTEHVSSVFSTELAAGYWSLVLDISKIGGANVPDPSVGTDEQVIKVSSGAYVLGATGSDTAYGPSWNGVTSIAPSKNAVYDYLEGFIEKRNTQVSGVNAEGHIFGLGITTSGQVITVSPGACLDSTETVQMALTTNATWTVPGTNNLETYLFLVRLVADGTFTVKGYSTYAGPSSDTLVDKWRFISWAKNNGSGVLMPYRQVGSELSWVSASIPIITTSLTASFVSYSLEAAVPDELWLCAELDCAPASGNTEISYQGTIMDLGVANNYRTSAKIISVPSIYMRYSAATTTVGFRSITLRR